MAEQKPRLIRNIRTGALMLEIPGVGRVALKDRKTGYARQISAVLKDGEKKKLVGSIDYNISKKAAADGSDYVAVNFINVDSKYKNKGIASSMLHLLEKKSKGKTIAILETHNPAVLRLFEKGGYARERDRDGFHGIKKVGEKKVKYRRILRR